MKIVITSTLAAITLFLGACASTPVSGLGSDINAAAGEYGEYSKQWERASRDERNALKMIEDGEQRIAKNEKKIREANKDIRKAEAAIERGEGEIRRGTREAEVAKVKRLDVEARYKDAARIDDERAAEGGVS
ncbi:MAG: hypothetical protein NXH70_04730 [Hyphomonas sp.]|nr:hypothetical protein [Hyphomonas sp.]